MRILRKGGRAIDWCTVIVIDSSPTSARQAVATYYMVSKVCAYLKSTYNKTCQRGIDCRSSDVNQKMSLVTAKMCFVYMRYGSLFRGRCEGRRQFSLHWNIEQLRKLIRYRIVLLDSYLE
jgi:hypothetical protein